MGAWGVAPAAVVGVLRPVGRAEVGPGDGGDGGPLVAPWRVHAPELEALATPVPVVEQHRAQRCRVRPVTAAEQVSVSTSAACRHMIKNYYY